PNAKIKLTEVKWLVWLYLGWTFWLASGHSPQDERLRAPLRCAECGGEMRVVNVTYDAVVIPKDNGLTYFDSG
ncbi:MAG: hypothetical protein ACI9G1_002605, partial [Pirellulaceae bacterium]